MADDDLYAFDSASVAAIADAVRQVLGSQAMKGSARRRAAPPAVNRSQLEFAQITSTSKTGNFYPGTLYAYNAATDTVDQVGDAAGIWVRSLGTCDLVTAQYYPVRRAGVDPTSGLPVFVFAGAGGASATISQVCVVDPSTCDTKTLSLTIVCGQVTAASFT